ncbi:hypothetical protein EYB53_012280 [Candidatus Chloroploca sp. M-50]|uniref:Chromosome partition protein Smc n=1 Tax=Candidatus Chloroploca mongolica TaxID=2528176 RepID=A0ABS4DAL1_9CHLR|nr:hypothetical protein [Candidatus Chloroploca mongolica]MBP1466483.1 hypothetical protein [Candidatus Chloroploca mongolica]
MSGRKQVTIDSADYRRLQMAEGHLRSMQQNLPEVLNRLMRDNEAELRRRLEPLEQRQREFQQTAQHMRQEVRQVETDMARRLEEQHRTLRQNIADTAKRLHDEVETAQREAAKMVKDEREARLRHVQTVAEQLRHETQVLMAEQSAQLTQLIDQERQTRETQIRAIHQRMESEQQRKDTLASSWIETAQILHDFIDRHYPHQQLAPNQLDRLARMIEQAQTNLAQGVAEAAVTMAQQAYGSLSDLRLELERLEREWQMWHIRSLETAREILALAQRNRTCPAMDLQANQLDIMIEVDYWTQGRLSALEAELNALITQITDTAQPLTTSELRQLAETALPSMHARLEQTIAQARDAVISSQLRTNIADAVVQAFEEQGFQLQDDTYEGEDQRHGFVAQVSHLDGSKVTVVVTPNDTGENNLNIHSYDAQQRPEHELRTRAEAIAKALRQRGLQTGAITSVDDQPDLAYARIDEVRERQPVRQQTRGS